MADDDILADVDVVGRAGDAPSEDAYAAGGSGAAAKKGRGWRGDESEEDRYAGKAGAFESLESDAGPGPQKSVEGWIVFVSGIHEEAQEDDVVDKFSEYGEVKNINLNLDRRTGFVKGYALIEYATRREADAAIHGMNGQSLLGKSVKVDWAFVKSDRR